MATKKPVFDVAVVGAGVFGTWTAYWLRREGLKVALLDAYGPGNSRASSGGESRIIRMGYGPDELYTRFSRRALGLWMEFCTETGAALFLRTGVLWLAKSKDQYTLDSLNTMRRLGIEAESLSPEELVKRFPQFSTHNVDWAVLEPHSGVLMARRAVQTVAIRAEELGVEYFRAAVEPPQSDGRLKTVRTTSGDVAAQSFVFACGPWLGQVFPAELGRRIFVTRQEVFFFGAPAGEGGFGPETMPAWLHHEENIYGLPDLEHRGVKFADDAHGRRAHPDTEERVPDEAQTATMSRYAAKRFPALKGAPLVEARVCQYENSSNGDFLIDRHPRMENVWLVGGGSGHGFKHGPAVGEYVRDRVLGRGEVELRFSYESKATVQKRAVY